MKKFISTNNMKRAKTPALIAVVALVVLIVVVTVAGIVSANKQADTYTMAKEKWTETVRDYANHNKELIFSDKMVTGRVESDDELKAQKSICESNAMRLNSIKNMKSDPEIEHNFFGFLSGKYRKYANEPKNSKIKAETTAELSKSFSEYDKVCRSYTLRVEAGKVEAAAIQRGDQYLSREGNGESGVSCAIKSCLPEDRAIWSKVADIDKAYVDGANKQADIYKNHCFSDQYKEVCNLYVAYYTEKAIRYTKYIDALRRGTTEYGETVEDLNKTYIKLLNDAYLKINKDYIAKYNGSDFKLQQDLMRGVEANIDTRLKKMATL